MITEEKNKINENEEKIESEISKENIQSNEIKENSQDIKEFKTDGKLNKSKEIVPSEAPPSIGEKIFVIDDSEFFYTIGELENKDGIYIKLEEVKPKNNVYFLYEASTEKLINEIKFLCIFENPEQRIDLLQQFFTNDKIKIIKNEEKYLMEI